MARVTLFDQASISPYSRFFWLEDQVTVVGHGLQPDDYITFETVETNAAPMARNCGCDFVPAGAISLNSILELTCTACNGVVSPVVLTAANPVVVLDHPQGFYLRAVYHGTGLSTGEVIVRATDTNTRDLTDALRGCPERCPDYVGTLCITPGTRAFGVNDPRDPEATVPIMREGSIVGYIYPTPRSHAPVPVTEDPCVPCVGNTVGAIIGYAMPWDGPETECLCLCYECQDVSWEQVGDTFCRNDTLWVNEISNCGRTRERDTGEACCVPNWTDVGAPYCVGDDCMQDQEDGCGNTRTVAGTGCDPECGICVPNWVNVGAPYCAGDNCMQDQEDGCGNTRTVAGTGCDPECGCVPNWPNSGPEQCVNGVGQQEQVDGCGGWRVVSTGQCGCRPDWINLGIAECVEGVLHMWAQELCSGTTVLFPVVPTTTCGDCVPEWKDVGSPVCEDGTLIQTRSDGCGNTETYDTEVSCADCEPDWQPTEEFNCSPTAYMRKWIDGCGVYEWREEGPLVWTNTGETQCVGGFLQERQQNQCGDLRWVTTSTPCGVIPDAELTTRTLRGMQALPGATYARAQYRIQANGLVRSDNIVGPPATLETWLVSGVNSDFEARATYVSGDVPAGPLNTWEDLTTDCVWTNDVTSTTPIESTAVITVEIRRKSDNVVLTTATITLIAELAV